VAPRRKFARFGLLYRQLSAVVDVERSSASAPDWDHLAGDVAREIDEREMKNNNEGWRRKYTGPNGIHTIYLPHLHLASISRVNIYV